MKPLRKPDCNSAGVLRRPCQLWLEGAFPGGALVVMGAEFAFVSAVRNYVVFVKFLKLVWYRVHFVATVLIATF